MPITPIDARTLETMLTENPQLQVIDVRTPEEYNQLGHLPQAQLMPIYELPYAFRVLNPHEDVVVLCQHGIRSSDACAFLQAQGLERLYNLQEGMACWEGALVFEDAIIPRGKELS